MHAQLTVKFCVVFPHLKRQIQDPIFFAIFDHGHGILNAKMERKEGGGGISTKRNSIRIKLEVQMIVCCLGLLTWLLTLRLSLYILMLFTVFSWSVRKIFCLTNNPQPRASGEFPRPRANIFPVKPSQLENNMCIIRALIQRLITFHFFFFFRWYVQISRLDFVVGLIKS